MNVHSVMIIQIKFSDFICSERFKQTKKNLRPKLALPPSQCKKCLAKSISQEWQQIGQSDHKGSTWGRPRCMLLYAASFFPYDFYHAGAMFLETSLSEVFGPFGGLLSRDDGVANFEILQSCQYSERY